MLDNFRIGTAGWSIPKQQAEFFAGEGTHLERYGQRFAAVEINSSFYRPHRPRTYERWAASVPAGFRVAVKMPREITHQRKLAAATEPLDRFLAEIRALGDRLGPVLVQLPPSLHYAEAPVGAFFDTLRAQFAGCVVCEPRHPTWFNGAVDELLRRFEIGRVAADPAPAAAVPGGWPGIVYRRLHGAPRMYYSAYSAEQLDIIAQQMSAALAGAQESWCIFDNTALGEATKDALRLLSRLAL